LKLTINLIGHRAGQIAPLLSGYIDHSVGIDLSESDLTIDTDNYEFLKEGNSHDLARDLALWITLVINKRNM